VEPSVSKRLAAAEQFVGRADELRQLAAAFTTSADGRGMLMMVSGEPGIGHHHPGADRRATGGLGTATALQPEGRMMTGEQPTPLR
jgi:hypothetical protein